MFCVFRLPENPCAAYTPSSDAGRFSITMRTLYFRTEPPMSQILVFALFRWLARWPLRLLHACGSLLGSLVFYSSQRMRQRIRIHLCYAGLPQENAMIKAVLRQTMQGALELPLAFFRQPYEVAALFREVRGWEHIQAALDAGEGLLLITSHLGSYDLAGRYLSHRLPFPLTAMYKPPKIAVLDAVMQAGRVRDKGRTAQANLQGVRQVMKALRAGEAVIVLPDQVPGDGDGVWVDFFGKPAYTMTLAAKLAQMPRVRTLFFCGERLPDSCGFALHIAPLTGAFNGDKVHDARLINHNVEAWVRRFPTQYLFGYNRYKGNPPQHS